MSWNSCKSSRKLLTVLVVAMGVVLFISTLGKSPRGPGGMDAIYFSAMGLPMIAIGTAIGYRRKGSWLILWVFFVMALMSNDVYFSSSLYKAVLHAPLPAIAWWTVDLLFGLSAGYLGRCKDADRASRGENVVERTEG